VLGEVCDVHVAPPFAVEMIVGDVPSTPPTAMQFDVFAHDKPWSATVTGPGGACAVQVEPPLVVAAISGATLYTLPTAQQLVALTHATSLYWENAPAGGA
jgi:hypothetical protein